MAKQTPKPTKAAPLSDVIEQAIAKDPIVMTMSRHRNLVARVTRDVKNYLIVHSSESGLAQHQTCTLRAWLETL